MSVLITLLAIGAIVIILLLCLAGTIMSCLALSGTWVIALAAAVAALIPGEQMPGWGLVGVFLLISAVVEGIEFLAGYWGVRKRDGSRLASIAALVGGLVGMLVGALIPPPFIGSLIGMIVVSFVLVYAVEHHRLKVASKAAHIAMGAVVSRVAVILLKVGTTLGMSTWLLVHLLLALW
ncbi:MAG: DUF456 domain-containing protein [Kiritimatiellae bacterium]|nr:DUF456 domain-containing protein [Kiritimatiellia bacterium]